MHNPSSRCPHDLVQEDHSPVERDQHFQRDTFVTCISQSLRSTRGTAFPLFNRNRLAYWGSTQQCHFGRCFRRGLCLRLRFAGRTLESSNVQSFLDLRARSPTRSSQLMSISPRLRLAMGFDSLHTLPGTCSGFHLHPHDLHFGDESLLRRQCLNHSLRASNRSSRGVVESTCKQAKKHCQPQTKASHLDWWRRIQYLRYPSLHSYLGKVEQAQIELKGFSNP
eukprot:s242_g37.t3